MRNISVIIGEVHEEIHSSFEKLIENNRNFDVMYKSKNITALLDAVRTQSPQLVFLSVDLVSDTMDGYELCQKIVSENPSVIVVMTSIYEKGNEIREAMRAGARELIPLGEFDSRLVATTLELVSNARKFEASSNDRKGKVISFLSAKGGVGKSTTITNIASELASRTNSNGVVNNVLILDYDLQFGDIAYLTNVKAQRTIADLNEMSAIDSDALMAHLVVSEEYKYSILTAPKTPQYADIIRKESLEQTITLAKRTFDYVLIDTSQGFTTATMVAVDQSDLVVVTSSGQMVDIKNLRIMLKTLEQLVNEDFPRERISVLLNQYSKNCVPAKEISSRLDFRVLGIVPKKDDIVSNANNYNKSVVIDFANSDVAKELKNITTNIATIVNPETKQAVEKQEKSKKSLFGAMFTK